MAIAYFVLDDRFCNECLYVFGMKKRNSIYVFTWKKFKLAVRQKKLNIEEIR